MTTIKQVRNGCEVTYEIDAIEDTGTPVPYEIHIRPLGGYLTAKQVRDAIKFEPAFAEWRRQTRTIEEAEAYIDCMLASGRMPLLGPIPTDGTEGPTVPSASVVEALDALTRALGTNALTLRIHEPQERET